MNGFDRMIRAVVGITGAFQFLVGVLIWVGVALPWIPVHMLVGLIFVLGLWALAFRAWREGAGSRIAAVTASWGVLILVFGMNHAQILRGENHWVIRLLHLLVGIAAMGMAGTLGRRLAAGSARASGERLTAEVEAGSGKIASRP